MRQPTRVMSLVSATSVFSVFFTSPQAAMPAAIFLSALLLGAFAWTALTLLPFGSDPQTGFARHPPFGRPLT
jgi:hypothetical protein